MCVCLREKRRASRGYDFSLCLVCQDFYVFYIIRSSQDWDIMSNQFDCILTATLSNESLKNILVLFRKGTHHMY